MGPVAGVGPLVTSDWGGTPVLRSPPCAGFVVLTRWSGAFPSALVRGRVLLLVVVDSSQPIEHWANAHAVECSRARREQLVTQPFADWLPGPGVPYPPRS